MGHVVQRDIILQLKATAVHETNPYIKAAVEGADDWATWAYLYSYLFDVYFEEDTELKEIWKPVIRLDNEAAQNHIKKPDFNTGLAMRKLCDREYFHRCWVLQELVLSKYSMIYMGRNEMSWDSFAAMMYLALILPDDIPYSN